MDYFLFPDDSSSLAWCWIDLEDPEILQSIIERMKLLPNLNPITVLAKRSDQSKNGHGVLHLWAKQPIDTIRVNLIMDFLQAGCDPSLKNKEGKTFLEGSEIKIHLLENVKKAPDEWAHGIVVAWIHNIGGK